LAGILGVTEKKRTQQSSILNEEMQTRLTVRLSWNKTFLSAKVAKVQLVVKIRNKNPTNLRV